MTEQVELEAYPDSQYRLLRNDTKLYYKGRVHEGLKGADKTAVAENGPHIEHFQDVFKYGDKLKKRNDWYKKLYDKDIEEGRNMGISAVSDVDDK
jgi:hypothetical protein